MSVKTVKYFKCDRCKKVFREDPGFKTLKANDVPVSVVCCPVCGRRVQ